MMTESLVPQIKNVIPISDSLFTRMNYQFATTISASQLDILFNANYGERNISPILQRIVVDPLAITDIELTKVSQLVLSVYVKKWDRMKSVYNIEYDTIHNYLDEYTESGSSSNTEETTGTTSETGKDTDHDTSVNTRTDNLSKVVDNTLTKKDTDVRTDNTTKTTDSTVTKNGTENEADSVYGFNSTASVNSESSQNTINNTTTDKGTVKDTGTVQDVLDTTSTGKTTTADTGTQKDDSTIDKLKNIERSGTNHQTVTDNGTKSKTYSHKGNIGNLTTQEMLKQELQLWEWNFIDSILTDVKDLLTLPIYL